MAEPSTSNIQSSVPPKLLNRFLRHYRKINKLTVLNGTPRSASPAIFARKPPSSKLKLLPLFRFSRSAACSSFFVEFSWCVESNELVKYRHQLVWSVADDPLPTQSHTAAVSARQYGVYCQYTLTAIKCSCYRMFVTITSICENEFEYIPRRKTSGKNTIIKRN